MTNQFDYGGGGGYMPQSKDANYTMLTKVEKSMVGCADLTADLNKQLLIKTDLE